MKTNWGTHPSNILYEHQRGSGSEQSEPVRTADRLVWSEPYGEVYEIATIFKFEQCQLNLELSDLAVLRTWPLAFGLRYFNSHAIWHYDEVSFGKGNLYLP